MFRALQNGSSAIRCAGLSGFCVCGNSNSHEDINDFTSIDLCDGVTAIILDIIDIFLLSNKSKICIYPNPIN
jgi:hypothetical protein